jgi:hypothetical protein
MILMRNRRAKEREDAIAQRLSNIPLVAMDRFHHQLECGVNDAACFFRV